jgi:hypothetical protein
VLKGSRLLAALPTLARPLKNMDSLSECRHPIADAILEYKKWQKLKEDVSLMIALLT